MLHSFSAMNTSFFTFGLTEQGQREAESWFAFVEKNLSRFLTNSELSRLNRADGKPFPASPLLFHTVSQAVYYYNYTEGLFHPFLGQALKSRGYDKSFECLSPSGSSNPDEVLSSENSAMMTIPSGSASAQPQLHPQLRIIQLPSGWTADLGGIAKGWSAEEFARMQRQRGQTKGVIDAGGDIMVWGSWNQSCPIMVAHPFEPDRNLLKLYIRETTGIATSSRLKRRWKDGNGNEQHHLTDPRTFASGTSDLVQVTVLHASLTAAEVAAKCLLLLGSEHGPSWLKRHFPLAHALMVKEDGVVVLEGDRENWENYNVEYPHV
ncbi:FAD:protein FMN transferase [Paenibacillus physcomitrellae]|uniref:FAD:protein FMN transferase n=1 Tax=Paenibacillus physcomitrellae TaxID=1619311 RepID=A0ABQ1GJB0_9BACL|nr:FAD:protein FMN transferase [Paenibacillus physcomitrellae]GGA44930.1 FAD:protein FMN transferase [Paenibacillus physcomitrellae]